MNSLNKNLRFHVLSVFIGGQFFVLGLFQKEFFKMIRASKG